MDEIDKRLEIKRKMHEQKLNQKKEELSFLNKALEMEQMKNAPKTEDELLAEAQAALQE